MRIGSYQLSVSVGGEMSRVDLPRPQPGEKASPHFILGLRVYRTSSTLGYLTPISTPLLSIIGTNTIYYANECSSLSYDRRQYCRLELPWDFPPHQVAYLDI